MNTPSSGDRSDSASEQHDHSFGDPERINRLRDEAELLAPLTEAAIEALRSAAGFSPTDIVDLGSGPGVGTCQLAAAFDGARVVAIDAAEATLDEAHRRATALGLGDRVETARLQLPDDLAALPNAEVYWASMAIHHVGDEVAMMDALRGRLRPGGFLCIVEWHLPPHPIGREDFERSGLSARLADAWRSWFAHMRSGLPGWVPSRPYPEMMADAGFSVVTTETLEHIFAPPLSDDERRFTGRWIAGTIDRLQPFADGADLETLAELIVPPDDEGGHPLAPVDVAFSTSRTLTIGTPRP